jgi:hypothetical protein
MLYRDHRGGLAESMATVVDLPRTRLALFAHLKSRPLMPDFTMDDMKVEFYTYDDRIDWNTYIVTINGNAVGFTNGPAR